MYHDWNNYIHSINNNSTTNERMQTIFKRDISIRTSEHTRWQNIIRRPNEIKDTHLRVNGIDQSNNNLINFRGYPGIIIQTLYCSHNQSHKIHKQYKLVSWLKTHSATFQRHQYLFSPNIKKITNKPKTKNYQWSATRTTRSIMTIMID